VAVKSVQVPILLEPGLFPGHLRASSPPLELSAGRRSLTRVRRDRQALLVKRSPSLASAFTQRNIGVGKLSKLHAFRQLCPPNTLRLLHAPTNDFYNLFDNTRGRPTSTTASSQLWTAGLPSEDSCYPTPHRWSRPLSRTLVLHQDL
jgi:hypothetical protein